MVDGIMGDGGVMIVRCVSEVRCDECRKAQVLVVHDKNGFVEPYSRLGWACGPKGSHLCPACFKKALTKRHGSNIPIVNGIMTVPPQP